MAKSSRGEGLAQKTESRLWEGGSSVHPKMRPQKSNMEVFQKLCIVLASAAHILKLERYRED